MTDPEAPKSAPNPLAPPPPGKVGGQRVYTGRAISLDVDEVRFPDGSLGTLEMIRHPGASAIVAFLDAGAATSSGQADPDPLVLLIRQYRYAADGYMYEIPAGKLDPGEAPAECALRELAEETGYRAGRLEPLFSMYTTPGFTDEQIHLFLATELTAGQAHLGADEFLELVPTPLSNALEMVRTGIIQDAKTALGLMYAVQFWRP